VPCGTILAEVELGTDLHPWAFRRNTTVVL